MVNLCLTSSKLRAIAQPVLYHNIYIHDGRVVYSIPLLNTLISRPDLARAVRRLSLTRGAAIHSEVLSPSEALSRPTQAARQVGVRLPGHDWMKKLGLQSGYFREQILLRVPHIEALALVSFSWNACDLFFSVDHQTTLSLPALRRLVLDDNHGWEGYDLSTMKIFCSIVANIDTLVVCSLFSISCTPSLQTSLALPCPFALFRSTVSASSYHHAGNSTHLPLATNLMSLRDLRMKFG